MKKLFIIYFICLGCLFSCGQTDQFSIEGTVEGKQDGKVFLVGYNESPDTLGWANIQDGKFVLKGKVKKALKHCCTSSTKNVYTLLSCWKMQTTKHI